MPEIWPVFSRKPIFGYIGLVGATLGIAILSVAVWAHHMFVTGAVDPPFFSVTPKGVVDLEKSFTRLINKARPLVRDGGRLIVINNALFTSGAEVMHDIEALAADGYLAVEALIPVPEDFTGYAGTRVAGPPVDPAPFNHPTKITILRVRKKAKQNDNP